MAYPLEVNGVLIGLHFLTPGVSAQETALEQLKQKYGEPTSLSTRTVQNAFGAKFEAISAVWELKGLRVSFEGVTGKIETGEVLVDLPDATALRKQWTGSRSSQERKL